MQHDVLKELQCEVLQTTTLAGQGKTFLSSAFYFMSQTATHSIHCILISPTHTKYALYFLPISLLYG